MPRRWPRLTSAPTGPTRGPSMAVRATKRPGSARRRIPRPSKAAESRSGRCRCLLRRSALCSDAATVPSLPLRCESVPAKRHRSRGWPTASSMPQCGSTADRTLDRRPPSPLVRVGRGSYTGRFSEEKNTPHCPDDCPNPVGADGHRTYATDAWRDLLRLARPGNLGNASSSRLPQHPSIVPHRPETVRRETSPYRPEAVRRETSW